MYESERRKIVVDGYEAAEKKGKFRTFLKVYRKHIDKYLRADGQQGDGQSNMSFSEKVGYIMMDESFIAPTKEKALEFYYEMQKKGIKYDLDVKETIMKREDLRKMIQEEMNEGTWAVPKDKAEAKKYIKILEKLKGEIYDVFGDDDVMDGFDISITRMREILADIVKGK